MAGGGLAAGGAAGAGAVRGGAVVTGLERPGTVPVDGLGMEEEGKGVAAGAPTLVSGVPEGGRGGGGGGAMGPSSAGGWGPVTVTG